MPKTTLTGHPLHPQMVGGPVGLIPMSLLLDLLYAATGNRRYADAAFLTLLGGWVSGVGAGLAGFGDYLSIREGSPAKKVARFHGLLNAGLLGVTSVGLLMRAGKKDRWGALPFALNAIGNAGLTLSAWYGGQLVFKHGVRVAGGEELEGEPEWKPPADDRMEEAFVRIEEMSERLYDRPDRNGAA